MSSSKRHWPSMFKSKPSNTIYPWHRHRDIINSALKPPSTYPSGGGSSEERITPEPKARWNPKPEQIRILEAIFNSGMVNPPRDEIRNIRAKLQEYGQVGDANVFYWFQNRKSRTKHKLRQQQQLQASAAKSPPPQQHILQQRKITPSLSSSSSSSEKSLSPNDSVNQPHGSFHARPIDLLTESSGGALSSQDFYSNVSDDHQTAGNSPNLLLTQLMGCDAVPGGGEMGGPAKSTVIVNGLALEVAAAHFDVKAAFGDEAVVVNYFSGQPVLTDECGVTVDPLQGGAYYGVLFRSHLIKL